MQNSDESKTFPAAQRALVLSGLARLESSGIPPVQAVTIVADDAPPKVKEACLGARALLEKGRDLGDALRLSRLCTDAEARMIRAATAVGSPASTLNGIAGHHEVRAMQHRRIRGRMLLPLALVAIAALVAPLPDLTAGRIDLAGYLRAVGTPLAVIAVPWLVWRNVRQRLADPELKLVERLPVIGSLVRAHARRDMLSFLGLALQAGLDADSALQVAADTVSNRSLQRAFAKTRNDVMQGTSVADALLGREVIDDAGYALISTGEGAGKLDEMIRMTATRLAEDIAAREDTLATWVPRIVYGLVVAWVASGILG